MSTLERVGWRFASLSLLALAVASPRSSWADGPLGENGQPIATSQYAVDLHQGAVLAGSRVVGMAGAYVAVAEDVDGNLQNPATAANRPFFSVTFFDWWLGLGATFPGTLKNMDFYNSGTDTEIKNGQDSLVFLAPALNLQWGPWGMGLTAEVNNFDLDPGEANQASLDAIFVTSHAQLARSFYRGQLVVGLGGRLLVMDLTEEASGATLFSTQGGGVEVGALYRPTALPFRLGFAARSPIVTEIESSDGVTPNETGDIIVQDSGGNDLYIPVQATQPWDINVGAAVQLGKRPLNLGWVEPNGRIAKAELLYERDREVLEEERDLALAAATTAAERETIKHVFNLRIKELKGTLKRERRYAYWEAQKRLARMKRFYVLLSTSMVMTGPSTDAVGVESFLNQTVRRSGGSMTFSPRLGAETELWPDVLKLRGGTYVEPPRLWGATSRIHGTAGLDLRLMRWSVFGIGPEDYLWKLAVSADVAERYFTWGVMVGGWYPRHSKDVDVQARME